MSPPGDRREPPADTKCPPAAQRKQAKRACCLYFGMPIGDQDKSWASHYICGSCRSNLEAWLRGERQKISAELLYHYEKHGCRMSL